MLLCAGPQATPGLSVVTGGRAGAMAGVLKGGAAFLDPAELHLLLDIMRRGRCGRWVCGCVGVKCGRLAWVGGWGK